MMDQIYQPELQLNKANASDTEAPFLDFIINIINWFLKIQCWIKDSFASQGRVSEFYGDLVYKFKMLWVGLIFLISFEKL